MLFTAKFVIFLCSVISQGKVVALVRWSGKWNHLSMTHRLATNYAKNYCNWTLIVKVIVENVVTCFFGTRCINRNCSLAQFSRLFIYGRSTVFKTISDGTRSLCFCHSCVVMRISNVDLLLYKEARLSLTTRAMLAPVSRGFCINSVMQQENHAVS